MIQEIKNINMLNIIKMLSNDLSNNIEIEKNDIEQEEWIEMLESNLLMINKYINEKEKEEFIDTINYMKCYFLWKNNRIKDLLDYIIINMKEKKKAIMYLILSWVYLYPIIYSGKVCDKNFIKENEQLFIKASDNFKSAYILLNNCQDKNKDVILSAISWSKGWMHYFIGLDKNKMIEFLNDGYNLDGKKFGCGWALFLKWIGNKLEVSDHMNMFKYIKNED